LQTKSIDVGLVNACRQPDRMPTWGEVAWPAPLICLRRAKSSSVIFALPRRPARQDGKKKKNNKQSSHTWRHHLSAMVVLVSHPVEYRDRVMGSIAFHLKNPWLLAEE